MPSEPSGAGAGQSAEDVGTERPEASEQVWITGKLSGGGFA
jgi:hypothetical protein